MHLTIFSKVARMIQILPRRCILRQIKRQDAAERYQEKLERRREQIWSGFGKIISILHVVHNDY